MRVYLAGPDVFEPCAKERGTYLVDLCKTAGLVGCFPLDATLDLSGLSKYDAGKSIMQHNVSLLESCDVILANLSSFRGFEPDSGTVWELAYGFARGKRVFAYRVPEADLRQQIPNISGIDKDGRFVEDFECPLNIMLYHSIEKVFHCDATAAIYELAEHLTQR